MEKALKELGFDEYVQDVLEVASEHKEQLKVGHSMILDKGEGLLMFVTDKGKEAEQIGAERAVGGGVAEAAAGAVSVCDG